METKNKRAGFSLAELLIVVAVIAVLVAIAIPIFKKKLEKSREAYDIYTMRQAASAAIDLYYSGVTDEASATAAGLKWWSYGDRANYNAAGAYDPRDGSFYPRREDLPSAVKTYGKGTKVDGGTKFVLGNPNGAYAPGEDYTNAVVMVAIYPNANPKHVDVYWKNNISGNTKYVGGDSPSNVPKYSIRVILD